MLNMAIRCPRPFVWLTIFCTGFITLAVLLRSFSEQISDDFVSTDSRSFAFEISKLPHSSWYGTKAYPTITSRAESWQWLMIFLQSISAARNIADVEKEAERMILAFAEANKQNASVVSVRFPNTIALPLEDHLAGRLHGVEVVTIPRYECCNKLCPQPQKNGTLITRLEFPRIPQRQTALINLLHCDSADADRIIRSVTDSNILLTAFRTENEDQAKDQNYALVYYELFHKTYFEHNWTPAIAHWKHCEKQRYGCQMWILWTRWIFTDLSTYIPPAGDGSVSSEVNRINRFFTNPDTDACNVRQAVGGTDFNFGFVDGSWTVCLDNLQKVTPSTCTVYSFGILNDWTFDDAMHNFGCAVYSFDPSIKLKAYQRNTHHWFFPWGLGNEAKYGWEMKTFGQIRKELKHTDQPLTVLKIDIEGDEWKFLGALDLDEDLKDVQQLTFESHPSGEMGQKPRNLALLLHRLEKLGFRMYSARQNPMYLDARLTQNNSILTGYLYEPAFIKNVDPLINAEN